jgi:hypothetical protein
MWIVYIGTLILIGVFIYFGDVQEIPKRRK